MTNGETYRMMAALRKHLAISVYNFENTLEIVLKFKTADGKLHQLCNSFVAKPQ
jgi:hypothetical protein